jgi:hypothetical protein
MYLSYLFDQGEIGGEVRVNDDLVPWETGGSRDDSVCILDEGDVDARWRARWRRALAMVGDGAKGTSAILSEMMVEDGQDGVHLARWIVLVFLDGVGGDVRLSRVEPGVQESLPDA